MSSLASAWLTDEYSTRVAVFVLATPANIIAGLMIYRSARYIRGDLSLAVAELREEMTEHERRRQAPDAIPVIQLADIDLSYGAVQSRSLIGRDAASAERFRLRPCFPS